MRPLGQGTCFWLGVLIFAVGTTAGQLRKKTPGVGFNLTPDYGTAAIAFQNGTVVEVARIEGSPAYKNFMRKAPENRPSLEKKTSPSVYSLLSTTACSLSRNLGFFYLCSENDSDFIATRSLLYGLQSSVAGYLETGFCFVDIAVPDPAWTYQGRIIDGAIRSIRLRQTHDILDAARQALVANRVEDNRVEDNRVEDGSKALGSDDDQSRAVLVVDYSRSGLNVALVADNHGVLDTVRKLYNQSLGRDSDPDPGVRGVIEAVAKVAHPPFGRDFSRTPITNKIRRLVLYGDSATSQVFLDGLEKLLGKDLLIARNHRVDPAFAVAIGIAKFNFESMENLYFDKKPAFGCFWSSKLYSGWHEEL